MKDGYYFTNKQTGEIERISLRKLHLVAFIRWKRSRVGSTGKRACAEDALPLGRDEDLRKNRANSSRFHCLPGSWQSRPGEGPWNGERKNFRKPSGNGRPLSGKITWKLFHDPVLKGHGGVPSGSRAATRKENRGLHSPRRAERLENPGEPGGKRPSGARARPLFCGVCGRAESCPTKKQQFDFAPSGAGSMEKKQNLLEQMQRVGARCAGMAS
jgi:hypothetical protein